MVFKKINRLTNREPEFGRGRFVRRRVSQSRSSVEAETRWLTRQERRKLTRKVKDAIDGTFGFYQPDIRKGATLAELRTVARKATQALRGYTSDRKKETTRSRILNRKFKGEDLSKIDLIGEFLNGIVPREFITALLKQVFSDGGGRRFALKFGNRFISLNSAIAKNLKHVMNAFEPGADYIDSVGSDSLNEIAGLNNRPVARFVELKQENTPGVRRAEGSKDGFYFAYSNRTHLDLTDYQIFAEDGGTDDTHCLIFTLRALGLSTELLKLLSTKIDAKGSTPKKYISLICKILRIKITLYTIDSLGKEKGASYGEGKLYKIALFKNHYFKYEPVETTKFFSNNYLRCMEHKNPELITKLKEKTAWRRPMKTKISSLRLITNLFSQGLFVPIVLNTDMTPDKITETADYFENVGVEQRPFEYKVKPIRDSVRFYGDFETDTHGETHKLLLAGIVAETDDEPMIYNSLRGMLNYIVARTKSTDDISLYFHNAKYDLSIIRQLIYTISSIEKGETVYTLTFVYQKRKITIKDSLKLIPFALSKFKKSFNLDVGKADAIAYNFYYRGIDQTEVLVDDYLLELPPGEHKLFRENLLEGAAEFEYRKDYLTGEELFNAMAYYKYYLRLDCLVLKQGMLAFNQCVVNITNGQLRAFDVNTMASLGHKMVSRAGCYDGLYEVCGSLRDYTAKAIFGGKCDINQKFVRKVVNFEVADQDANSLYPSAMVRLCREFGLPMGMCQHYRKTEDVRVEDFDYHISTVRISKINKKLDMPIVSYRTEGKLLYLNEIPMSGITVVIDKYTLGDWIEFQDIDYEIVEGVYWNGGFNKRMGTVITNLYSERMKYKTGVDKNIPMSNTLKLILNAIYGKTITKKTTSRIIYKKRSDVNYRFNNFNSIVDYWLEGQQYKIKQSCMDLSYGLNFVGVGILSFSKRMMNEPMTLMSENGLTQIYQDTDSIIMASDGVKKLEELYLEKYGRVFSGSALEQFSSDFEEGDVGTRMIALSRKVYAVEITNTDSDGVTTTRIHARMKGIPNRSIEFKAKELGLGLFELYEYMAKRPVEFCLNPNKFYVSFDFKHGGVLTRKEGSFKRILNCTARGVVMRELKKRVKRRR